MEIKKQSYFFIFLIFLIRLNFIILNGVNVKEELFIKLHLIDSEISLELDKIFNALSAELGQFFLGDFKVNDFVKIQQELNKAGFRIISVQLRKKKRGRDIHVRAVLEHEKCSSYFLKLGLDSRFRCGTISRIVVADFMNYLYKNEFLYFRYLAPVEKKLYHRPGRGYDLLDSNYIVLSPKVKGCPLAIKNKKISYINEKMELVFNDFIKSPECIFLRSLLGESWDCHNPCNFIISGDSKLTLIDTEPTFLSDYSAINNLFFVMTGKYIN